MDETWIKLYRKIEDSSFYHDSELVHLWIHLLIKAFKFPAKWDWNGKEITIKPGQFITGRKKLSEQTGISESKIQRSLKKFEKCHMIEQQTNSRSRLITIVTWDRHQGSEQQMNNQRTTSEQPANTNKERKKERKKELIISVVDYLNEKLGTNYKPNTEKTKTCINARINEGNGLEQFKIVIDKKYNDWVGTDNAKYLRPQTLFGTNFDGYLNQLNNKTSPSIEKLSLEKFKEAILFKINNQKPGHPFKFKNAELNKIIEKHPMINDYSFNSIKFTMAYEEYLKL